MTEALKRLFAKHRIVFWYDDAKELRSTFEELTLPGVKKIELANNEFTVKYHILREKPDQQFLVYKNGPEPEHLDNWLLDVQLAHTEFRTDQLSLWLSDLGLGAELYNIAQEHVRFFRAAKRRNGLKRLLGSVGAQIDLRLLMAAVCVDSDPVLDNIVEALLDEAAASKDEKLSTLALSELEEWLWEKLTTTFGYSSTQPSIHDFAIELFKSSYSYRIGDAYSLNRDAHIFFNRWKDSNRFQESFRTFSENAETALNIEQDLLNRELANIIELDHFRLIDLKVISELSHHISNQTISHRDIASWLDFRRQGFWFAEFEDLYEALGFASLFNKAITEFTPTMNGISDGVQNYSKSWFVIDQVYRKFIFHAESSGQATLLHELQAQVENHYINTFLLPLNNQFQRQIDKASHWAAQPIVRQNRFYDFEVKPFLDRSTKVVVIISDALRYEIGEELNTLINQENRFKSQIAPLLAMIPSYTQLGMAALLPNKQLELQENESGVVLVDGVSSQGIQNRKKILANATDGSATAISASEVLEMPGEAARELIRDHSVVYVYHNRIDSVADKRDSEDRVFEAVEETMSDLLRLVKKLTSANANNLLITADHGFLYQKSPVSESDFLLEEPQGSEVFTRDRRFIIGRSLQTSPGVTMFSSENLGLAGQAEVQIVKSNNRLRQRGSGSRFVHGGAALQEVVIPLLRVNKRRENDVELVEVEILRGGTALITSAQITVTLYQVTPVSDKVQPRALRIGLYTSKGELISDTHTFDFDETSEHTQDRERAVTLNLTREADNFNNQNVYLRLEEPYAGTTHFKEYKSISYQLRRSFTTDFDF